MRFISLNALADLDCASILTAQTAWLDRVLEENPNKWSVVSFHQPVFSVTPGRDNKTIRDAWLPVFEKHGVDLVLQGHDHAYGRGNLADAARRSSRRPAPSTWSRCPARKMYARRQQQLGRERRGCQLGILTDTQLYQVISVSGHHSSSTRPRPPTAGSTTRSRSARTPTGKKTITEWEGSTLAPPGLPRGRPARRRNRRRRSVPPSQGSGSIDRLNVYLEEGRRPRSLAGRHLHRRNGRPGELIASGEDTTASTGARGTLPLPGDEVEKDERYWIALLGLDGFIEVRDECCGAAGTEPTETSKTRGSQPSADLVTGAV